MTVPGTIAERRGAAARGLGRPLALPRAGRRSSQTGECGIEHGREAPRRARQRSVQVIVVGVVAQRQDRQEEHQ